MQLKENVIYKVDLKRIFREVGQGVKEEYKQHLLKLGEFFRYERINDPVSNGHYLVTVFEKEPKHIGFSFLNNNTAPMFSAEYLIEVIEVDELAKAHLLGL